MRISAKTSYERYSKTKLPFLTYGEDGGMWDWVSREAFVEARKRCLKDYLVYRQYPRYLL
jgi:hypothetical protein